MNRSDCEQARYERSLFFLERFWGAFQKKRRSLQKKNQDRYFVWSVVGEPSKTKKDRSKKKSMIAICLSVFALQKKEGRFKKRRSLQNKKEALLFFRAIFFFLERYRV